MWLIILFIASAGLITTDIAQFFICFEFYNSSAEHNNINNTT